MKSRAAETAPEAHLALWRDTSSFFRLGGNRNWASFLTDSDMHTSIDVSQCWPETPERWVLAGRAGIRD
jgi:hypothetical protein